MSKWIPITERMPECNRDVMISFMDCNDGIYRKTQAIGHFVKSFTGDSYDFIVNGCSGLDCDSDADMSNIIDWQPLPDDMEEQL